MIIRSNNVGYMLTSMKRLRQLCRAAARGEAPRARLVLRAT